MQAVKEIYYFGTRNVPHRVTRFVPWEGHPSYLGKVTSKVRAALSPSRSFVSMGLATNEHDNRRHPQPVRQPVPQ